MHDHVPKNGHRAKSYRVLTQVDKGCNLRTDMENTLMTRLALSLHFDVSERTITRWEKIGMPVIKIGKVRRYDLAKVMEWVYLNEVAKEVSK